MGQIPEDVIQKLMQVVMQNPAQLKSVLRTVVPDVEDLSQPDLIKRLNSLVNPQKIGSGMSVNEGEPPGILEGMGRLKPTRGRGTLGKVDQANLDMFAPQEGPPLGQVDEKTPSQLMRRTQTAVGTVKPGGELNLSGGKDLISYPDTIKRFGQTGITPDKLESPEGSWLKKLGGMMQKFNQEKLNYPEDMLAAAQRIGPEASKWGQIYDSLATKAASLYGDLPKPPNFGGKALGVLPMVVNFLHDYANLKDYGSVVPPGKYSDVDVANMVLGGDTDYQGGVR